MTIMIAKYPRVLSKPTELTEKSSNFNNTTMKMKNEGFWRRSSCPCHKVFYGNVVSEVPTKKLLAVSNNWLASYCAPDDCLHNARSRLTKCNDKSLDFGNWDQRQDFSNGNLLSLYEKDTLTKIQTGDPVADSLAVVSSENCGILAIADGVSWGSNSKMASNCAIHGVMSLVIEKIGSCATTHDVFIQILRGFQRAHNQIVEAGATLTTLCVGVVVPLKERDRWAFCVVNLGDSYAYVYNQDVGVLEVTCGSHPLNEVRDMRVCGGALGPADGVNPDLGNLTISFVVLRADDFVFMCSDGVSDNYDPVVAKYIPKFISSTISAQDLDKKQKQQKRNTVQPYEKRQSEGVLDLASSDHKNLNSPKLKPSISCDSFFKSTKDMFDIKRKRVHTIADNTIFNDLIRLKDEKLQDFKNSDSWVEVNNFSVSSSLYKYENSDENIRHSNSSLSDKQTGLSFKEHTNEDKVSGTTFNEHHLKESIDIAQEKEYINQKQLISKMRETNIDRSRKNIEIMVEDFEKRKDIDCKQVCFKEGSDVCSEPIYLTPFERWKGSLERMTEVIRDLEHANEDLDANICAEEVCAALIMQAYKLTEERRLILENAHLHLYTGKQRKEKLDQLNKQLQDVPGKLDHASIVCYKVGWNSTDNNDESKASDKRRFSLPAFYRHQTVGKIR